MTISLKTLSRRAAFLLLASDPALGYKLRSILRAEALTILNFHRVSDDHTSGYEAMSPKLFEQLIGWLKLSFTLVTFADLAERLPHKKPPMVLSFDDGYKDFIENVCPILAKHRVSANQNIIPGCVEDGLPPMNVLMQDFIYQAPRELLREVSLPGLPHGADPDDRVASSLVASASLKNRPIREQKAIFSVIQPHFERFEGFAPTPLMCITDIIEISSHHEIGTHSFEHATMSFETDNYVDNDAKRCHSWHTEKIGVAPNVYAFPNGGANHRQVNIVRSAGYKDILLVGERFSSISWNVHPRFTMHGSSVNELRFRATGAKATPRRPLKHFIGLQ
jgi:peptidoglycan/xylan/chitin deacetylase (PgdA/CDA1 family)